MKKKKGLRSSQPETKNDKLMTDEEEKKQDQDFSWKVTKNLK